MRFWSKIILSQLSARWCVVVCCAASTVNVVIGLIVELNLGLKLEGEGILTSKEVPAPEEVRRGQGSRGGSRGRTKISWRLPI